MLTFISGTRAAVQAHRVADRAINRLVAESTTAAAEDVACDIGALGIPAEHQARVGTPVGVRGHLRDAVSVALRDRRAVVGVWCVVELDVLVVAARQAGADRPGQLSLSPRVFLIPPLRQEDVHVRAGPADGLAFGPSGEWVCCAGA